MKLELILRLLDNDELSPEQVNDVKDFLDDYVERNQVWVAHAWKFVSLFSLKYCAGFRWNVCKSMYVHCILYL